METTEIKRRISIETVVTYYGGILNAKGQGQCLFPQNHNNGDVHPSMAVHDGHVKCWSQGCFGETGVDVFELVGIKEGLSNISDQMRRVCEIGGIADAGNVDEQRRIVALYNYTDETGTLLYQVVRYEPKDFRQRRPDGHGGWASNLHGVRRVLYRLPDVVKAENVLLLEGEKDVDTAYQLGLPAGWTATCNPMGAGKWQQEYSDTLRGKRVAILPDADDPGRKHGDQIARSLEGKASAILTITLPHGKDLSEWVHAGGTVEAFALLLDQAEPYLVEEECTDKEIGPWNKAQTAKDFLTATEKDVPMLEPYLLARGSLTEIFSPRGIGKTHVLHWLAVKLAKEGTRVLLLDRDNSKREVARRLRSWDAGGLITLKVMTRDEVPPLKDAEKWGDFPFSDYDVVLIDSLESSMEGAGEQDSAKPSKAIAPLLDIAHRDNGPAILVLGNTVRSGEHSRGSGVVEDRADVAYEVRDATDLKPSGTKDWWHELPQAGAATWAGRASRRKRRDTYRLAFIPSKYRIGEEPDPFIWEITMPDGEPWTVCDVTADVVKAGEDAKQAADTERRATLDRAALALADQVRQRAEAGNPMLSEKEAVPYLTNEHDLKRKDARRIIKDKVGTLWDLEQGKGKGHPQILVPVGYKTNMAAKMPSEERPYKESPEGEAITAERMDIGRRKSGHTETASSAGETALLFSPPDEVMPPRSGLGLQPLDGHR